MAQIQTASKASTTKQSAIERKALSMDNKSEGMRLLFDDGYTVVQVRQVFNAPYGYVYGVAQRHGVADSAATRRAPRKATTKAKAPARSASKTKATGRQPSKAQRQLAAPAPRTRKTKAAPVAKVVGRPTATRRAANRKVTVAKA